MAVVKISPARAAAFRALLSIDFDGGFSSIVLPAETVLLSSADRSLCYAIVLGTLRRQIFLDAAIDRMSGAKKIDPEIRTILRSGLYQILFLDRVPDYSVVNDCVNLATKARKTSAKTFVNAILRRAARGFTPPENGDEVDRLSIETSHPRWLLEKWTSDFGLDMARSIAAANNDPGPIAFRLTNRSGDAARKAAVEARQSDFVKGCYVVHSITPELIGLAESGEIYFQDEASQMVGQVVVIAGGTSLIDICAAPGSKSSQIAFEVRAEPSGTERAVLTSGVSRRQTSEPSTFVPGSDGRDSEVLLIAGDRSHGRIASLARTLEHQNVRYFVSLVQYDAEVALPFVEGRFDTILVDAPCSGSGTIRHNPEIRYRISPDRIAELSRKQRRILENASNLVRPGGTLIYSTCSLERDENENVARRFLASSREFSLSETEVASRFTEPSGFARTFPHRDDMDGFFIATFRRRP